MLLIIKLPWGLFLLKERKAGSTCSATRTMNKSLENLPRLGTRATMRYFGLLSYVILLESVNRGAFLTLSTWFLFVKVS